MTKEASQKTEQKIIRKETGINYIFGRYLVLVKTNTGHVGLKP